MYVWNEMRMISFFYVILLKYSSKFQKYNYWWLVNGYYLDFCNFIVSAMNRMSKVIIVT